ncbi:MAG: regulatory protein RecX [Lachnospiraceae bacterium]|nr:regulatory protein RecX [Lachnospiraceae bacterium]
MIITDIVDIDRKRSKIYVDNELLCSLYKGEMIRLGIKKHNELSQDTLTEIYSVLYKRARERSFCILTIRDYTEYEMRNKLKRGYYPEEIICKVIDKLKEYGYIDDERFVNNYIDRYINDESKRLIRMKLSSKGISEELIKGKLSNNNIDSAQIILDKHSKILNEMIDCDDKTKSKLMSRLLRRGFSFEDITRAINMLKSNEV